VSFETNIACARIPDLLEPLAVPADRESL